MASCCLPEEAIGAEEKALDLDPEMDDAHLNIALACESLGQFDRAIAHLYAEKEIDDWETDFWLVLGRIYYRLKEYDWALKYLQRAVEESPNPINHLQLSRVYHALGREADAAAEFERGMHFKAKP